MALAHIPLSQLTESHIQRLVTDQTAESLHVEYKREMYGTNDDQRREFLADASSLANTAGGDIIIGVEASNSVPTKICGIADGEKARERLESMALSGLEPRIVGLQTKSIPLASGGSVVLVRVPKSYNRPRPRHLQKQQPVLGTLVVRQI